MSIKAAYKETLFHSLVHLRGFVFFDETAQNRALLFYTLYTINVQRICEDSE